MIANNHTLNISAAGARVSRPSLTASSLYFKRIIYVYADLSEVTFEASKKKWKNLPRLMPLAEAIQTVVHHQAADTLP